MEHATLARPADVRQVHLTRVDIPFFQLVMFLVKLTIASIPAMLIVYLIAAFFVLMLGAGAVLFDGLG